MDDGIRKTLVSQVAALKEIKRFSGHPSADFHAWQRSPRKRAQGIGLVQTIDGQRVVRRRAAELIP